MEYTPEEVKWLEEDIKMLDVSDVVKNMNEWYLGYFDHQTSNPDDVNIRVRSDWQKYGSQDDSIVFDRDRKDVLGRMEPYYRATA